MTTPPLLQPYPAYKPSGAEWLGDVPAHWDVRRLKHWVDINQRTLSETTDPSFEFRYIEIGAVSNGKLTEQPARIRFANAPSRARRVLRTGDTIISTVRTYLKAVWFADDVADDLVCSTGFAVLTPRPGTVPKFVSYLAQSDFLTGCITVESVGIAYPAIAESAFGNLNVPVPPPDEQAAIVRYLDDATGRLDRCRGAKTRLIALLDEYCQAAIHQAVTRGLNPDVPLKPAGDPWLGDAPAHWAVRRLKNICRLVYGDSLPDGSRAGGAFPVYGSNGQVGLHNQSNTNGECVVIGRKGSFGKVHYSAGPAFAIDTTFLVDSRSTNANIRWLYYMLGYLRLDEVSKDSAVPGLNRDDAYQRTGFYPPLEEQVAIAAYLDRVTADIDAAIAHARREIELLDEYRASLIAAVVTGRLDVRAAGDIVDAVTV